jgi:hypothetical protein
MSVTKNPRVLLIVLTVLVTTVLVHAVFAVWWMVVAFGKANPPSFDWTGSLATSGIAIAVVLAAGLVVQRLLGHTGIVEAAVQPVPAPPHPAVRPVSEKTVVVTRRRPVTSA